MHGVFGDLVEDDAADGNLRLEHLRQMPADRLAFAIRVGGQQQLRRVLERGLQVRDLLLLVAGNDVVRREVAVDVDAEPPPLGSDYSIYCRFSTPNIASARHVFVLTDGTTNEYVGFLTNTTARLAVVDGGSAVGAITGASLTANTAVSLAARIKTNDCALSVGGGAVVTDTSVSLPTVTEVRFGGVGSNALATASYQIQKMVIVVPSWNNATLVTKSGS